MEEFLAFLNDITGNRFNFSIDKHVEEFYHRYSMDTVPKTFSKRRRALILRLRDYLQGPREGLTTVDMKFRDGDSCAYIPVTSGKGEMSSCDAVLTSAT